MEQFKSLTEITRQEWIAFRWVEIPPVMVDDNGRMFRPDGRRTPDEAMQAMGDWELTAEEREFEEKGNIQ